MDKIKATYPAGVLAVYDNGGKTFDRYTVYYTRRAMTANPRHWAYVGMSAYPFHPQGIGQHGEGILGRHNGKRISFEALPLDCQRLVKQDLK